MGRFKDRKQGLQVVGVKGAGFVSRYEYRKQGL